MVRGAEVTELRGELDLLGLRVGVFQQVELAMKRLQLMKELLPSVGPRRCFKMLIGLNNGRRRNAPAKALGLRLAGIELKETPYDYEVALNKAAPDYQKTLVVMTSTEFFRPPTSRHHGTRLQNAVYICISRLGRRRWSPILWSQH